MFGICNQRFYFLRVNLKDLTLTMFPCHKKKEVSSIEKEILLNISLVSYIFDLLSQFQLSLDDF
jgi:hypothetical protein